MRELTSLALAAMRDAGAQKAQCRVIKKDKQEFNVEKSDFSLFRSTHDIGIALTALVDGKKASLAINQLDEEAIKGAAAAVVGMAADSQADPANDIAALEDGPTEYTAGLAECDRDGMFSRMHEFLGKVKADCPSVTIVDGQMDFTKVSSLLQNTNGVELSTTDGYYTANCTFGARDGQTASSMNYSGGALRTLDRPLWDSFGFGALIEQNIRELAAKPFKGKFNGDLILTPYLLSEFISMYIGAFLSDGSLVSGTSMLKDMLGQKVASEQITIYSDPTDATLVGSPVTADGFRAKKMNIIRDGVLESFVLSQYGAAKIGRERSGNLGDNASLMPGDTPLEELIRSVDRGLLVGRFSGGVPSDSGDFSGVAKNSFYIENGKIAYPVTETMISGNLRDILHNVRGISKETLSSGFFVQPWICVSGANISGS